MLYILAIVFPPVATLFVGKWLTSLVLLILMLLIFSWPIASIIALVVVSSHKADMRSRDLIKGLRETVDTYKRQQSGMH